MYHLMVMGMTSVLPEFVSGTDHNGTRKAKYVNESETDSSTTQVRQARRLLELMTLRCLQIAKYRKIIIL